MRFFRTDLTVSQKPDHTPVTEADLATERIIVAGLRDKFDYPILAEETVDDPARFKSEYVWIVDPLDGTRNFSQGDPNFGVLIGLIQNSRPVLGVVFLPALDKLYFAEAGKGAYLSVNGALPVRIRVSAKNDPAEMRVFISKQLVGKMELLHSFGFQKIERFGGFSPKAVQIADGEADIYLNIDPKGSEWDTCAPEVIVTEAGGRMTDMYGAELPYNQENPARLKGDIVSNGSEVHAKVVRELIPQLRSEHA